MRLRELGLACLVLTGTPAAALEAVNVSTVGIENDDRRSTVEDRLESASASETALRDKVTNPQDVLGAALSDYSRLLGVLYQFGYYGPAISIKLDGQEAAEINPFAPAAEIHTIDIVVTPGVRFRFGEATVAPRSPKGHDNPIVPGFQTGAVANSTLIGEAANTGIREWREGGYAKAVVADQSIVANHPEKRLDVDIELDPGRRLTFGNVTFSGDTKVREERLREIMGFPTGVVYSPERLRTSVDRLRRTGTFRTLAVSEADTPNPDDSLDYSVVVVDQKPRRIGFVGEYSTLDGLTFGAFWVHRNVFGGAERLRVDLQASNIAGSEAGFGNAGGADYSAAVRLTRPATFGADNDVFGYGNISYVDDPEYTEAIATFGAGISRHFNKKYYGETAIGLRYSDVTDAFGDSKFYHVVFPSQLEWENRRDKGNPKTGSYANFLFTPYIGLNGSESGSTNHLDLRAYQGIGEGLNPVFAGRIQIGSVVGSSLSGTPPDFLFFSGGSDSVRGQHYQSLGVNVGNGKVSGGRSFVGFQGEIRANVRGPIGMVAFMDAGYIGPDSYYTDAGNWQSGLGVGLRYATVIGPLRLDLATPYTGTAKEFSRVEVYLGVGQAF